MNNLKELREQLGLQQKEFCEPLGIWQKVCVSVLI